MLCYFFLISLINSIECLCSAGYEDTGGGSCYRTFTTPNIRSDAEAFCERQGGHLAQPRNAFVNTLIQNEAHSFDTPIWLGVTCLGETKTSCTYSDGNKLTESSYTNFHPGHPNPKLGRCVFLSAFGSQNGHWISGDCSERTIGFGCEISSSDPGCGSAYFEFENFCYQTLAPATALSAESTCQVECAHLTSIHSDQENEFILAISSALQTNVAFIGLEWTKNIDYEWTDGTVSPEDDFQNFGHEDHTLGDCVGISLTDDGGNRGKWTNTPCSNISYSVCKRTKSKPCVSFATPTISPFTGSPTILPSLAPPTCSSTISLEQNGTIYSPGYPADYTKGLHCEYIITAPPEYIVLFSLDDTYSFQDSASNISLYNSAKDSVPFLPRVLYGFGDFHTMYATTTSTMKVKFSSGRSDYYKWTASYNSVDIRASGCNQGLRTAPGIITSPNYPVNYPSQYNCKYHLEAPFTGQRVTLHFNHFFTEHNFDLVTIYDGSEVTSAVLATYSGKDGQEYPTVTSSGNKMVVTFNTDYTVAYQGFTATFTAE